jgi:dethiobiotin synthetase
MSRGIYIIGTDTDVGKTFVAAGLMHLLLKSGCRAAYFKPVASGMTEYGGVRIAADAAFVHTVSGFDEPSERVTPFAFAEAVAPHLAARIARRLIDPYVIHHALNDLKTRYNLIIAEGAGGLAVPFNDEGAMQADVIRKLGFPCLLVARAGLGTINHTLLTLEYARNASLRIKGILINRAGESLVEQDNIAMIKKLSGIAAIFTLPVITAADSDKLPPERIRKVFEQAMNISDIIALTEII